MAELRGAGGGFFTRARGLRVGVRRQCGSEKRCKVPAYYVGPERSEYVTM